MTPYDLLRRTCGLSQPEAAQLHGVRIDTVKSWCSGRNRAPDGVIEELRALWRRISGAADNAIVTAHDLHPRVDDVIEIGYPADDHEAAALGFPCVGAWRAMAGLVIAEIGRPIDLAPRGSTLATAADGREGEASMRT